MAISPNTPKHFPERTARPLQSRLHRAHFDPYDFGNLRQRKLLVVRQDENFALRLRQSEHGPRHHSLQFRAQRFSLGRAQVGRWLGFRRRILAPAKALRRLIPYRSEEVNAQRGAPLVKAAFGPQQPEKAFLYDVFGILHRPRQPVGKSE
jgi:hypothetical protein